jgi:hypothetical protein
MLELARVATGMTISVATQSIALKHAPMIHLVVFEWARIVIIVAIRVAAQSIARKHVLTYRAAFGSAGIVTGVAICDAAQPIARRHVPTVCLAELGSVRIAIGVARRAAPQYIACMCR